jgi:FMN-dependent NADH-azoreductase
MNILKIDSGLFAGHSVSRQLTEKVIEQFASTHKNIQVVVRDLVANPIGHLDGEIALAAGTLQHERTERQVAELALTEELLEELFAADVIVLGAPMYNFSVPSQLKAWIDRIAQPGRTFRYTEAGAEGLLTDKKAIIVSARGGVYSKGAAAANEHQESYLQSVLAFIGMTDITIIRAEGLKLSSEIKARAVDDALNRISLLSPDLYPAPAELA